MTIKELEYSNSKLVKRLRKSFWRIQEDFNLVEEGDLVMACLSGGKDSYTMLDMLQLLQKVRNFDFDIIAVNLDQKQPGYPQHILPSYLQKEGVEHTILEKNTYGIVNEKIEDGKTMCSLCSRLRRGTLYEYASKIGATKIALGHHREDVLETFLMNLFFGGKLEAMPPKYITDDQQHIVIRPLAFAKEADIAEYALLRDFPIIPCNLCGSQPNMQRQIIKNMMNQWEQNYPDRKEIMMTALKNVHLSHLFDSSKYNFDDLKDFAAILK